MKDKLGQGVNARSIYIFICPREYNAASKLFTRKHMDERVKRATDWKNEKPLSIEEYMKLEGVRVLLYYFIVVVKYKPWLFDLLRSRTEMAALLVLANSLKVV